MVAAAAFRPKHWISILVALSGMFSARSLENAIKSVMEDFCRDPAGISRSLEGLAQSPAETCPHRDQVFRDESCCKDRCLSNNKTQSQTLFRTYETNSRLKDCKTWEVVRATSSAATSNSSTLDSAVTTHPTFYFRRQDGCSPRPETSKWTASVPAWECRYYQKYQNFDIASPQDDGKQLQQSSPRDGNALPG
ncbi:hypothetical protein OIDMADRAFT_174383 [Oidiodendron maius Zn]|uniref:Uncharacterized protein n=1 Tax=Oidiodendron maius (strain Zn) TaxID=913774 RepID=A0A0C3HGS8_OIDMZ|nr:hypothetical protein OIDMADRAFT_174383 [Oidiodendron maius Zn]